MHFHGKTRLLSRRRLIVLTKARKLRTSEYHSYFQLSRSLIHGCCSSSPCSVSQLRRSAFWRIPAQVRQVAELQSFLPPNRLLVMTAQRTSAVVMTKRKRRVYDHRIKEPAIRSRNPHLFFEPHVLPSTARSWIRRSLGEVVSLQPDSVGENVLRERVCRTNSHGGATKPGRNGSSAIARLRTLVVREPAVRSWRPEVWRGSQMRLEHTEGSTT